MNRVLKSLVLAVAAGGIITTVIQPAHAQYMGSDSHEAKVVACSDAPSANSQSQGRETTSSPKQVIHPEGNDPTSISAVNTAGTVRINMLANVEALLNVCANGAEMICFFWGAALLWACFRKIGEPGMARSLAFAMLPIILGLCTPGSINWAVATARDANFFS
ncbi:MAG: hypothetical protein K2X77_08580 [Candidatus Obscuribacterales bacterium]|jgi:hypothetical protein|nr:hypothetical protein [Candidatus Obscuribacterales bacterium]